MFTEILFLILLILINAFFAASEIALISLNDNKIKLLADRGDKKAKQLQNLLLEPSRFLATIQIGITFAGFLASAVAAESFSGKFSELMKLIGIAIPDVWLNSISVVIITIILSFFTLVLGELVPKRLAMKKAEPISMFVVGPLNFLLGVTYPFVKLLTISTNIVARVFGVSANEEDENVTEEEIRMMVDVGEEKGTIDSSEKTMINNIFEFNNKTVVDIMVHRTDIAALSVEADLNEVILFINQEKYSRIPIYQNNIDNIIGILHTKHIIKFLTNDKDKEGFDLKKIIKQPYFVPSSKRTDELFKDLQQNSIHLAVIIDEYGGTAGIATLEDLIEEIVGDIFDEDDDVDKIFEKLDENTFIINGSADIDIVNEYLKIKLPAEEYETLSGFIIGQIGRIPGKDEQPSVEFKGFMFTVEKLEEKRIAKVKVCKTGNI